MKVVSVSRDAEHRFSKRVVPSIRLLTGLGVEGDAHAGHKVKHRSRVRQNPDQPNLRQVHLIHAELLDELTEKGFTVRPGDLGENILTRDIDLLGLPRDTTLRLGPHAVVAVTGLRNPCVQIEHFQSGVLAAVLDQDEHGHLVRKAGIMGVVVCGGEVQPGDGIQIVLPPQPHCALEKV